MTTQSITKVETATNQNLNQAENTVLLTYVASKPCIVQRFGVVANASEGLLAAMRLKMRLDPINGDAISDLSGMGTLNPGGAIAQGNGVYKNATDRVEVEAGDHITVAVDTAAGGTSTGDVFLEVEELPFAGSLIDNMSASA